MASFVHLASLYFSEYSKNAFDQCLVHFLFNTYPVLVNWVADQNILYLLWDWYVFTWYCVSCSTKLDSL